MEVLEESINIGVMCHVYVSGFPELKECVYECDTLAKRSFLVVLQRDHGPRFFHLLQVLSRIV